MSNVIQTVTLCLMSNVVLNFKLCVSDGAGLSEWEDDRVLAAVLAASQQEYLQGLKQGSRGAESL